MEPEYKEEIACTNCGSLFKREARDYWKKICIVCYIESKRPPREYFVSEGVTVTGSHYKPDGCDCGLPPWELCRPNCEHAIGAT